MKTGLLLISLGLGYKILIDALKEKGSLKVLGIVVAAVMMLVSAVGTGCIISYCTPSIGKKVWCPLSGAAASGVSDKSACSR